MLKRIAPVLLIAAAAGGCKNSSLGGDMSSQQGTVAGLLLEAGSERPLADAIIRVVSGGETRMAYSDADGIFRVSGVPSGAFVIQFENEGYVPFYFNATLPGSVGDRAIAQPQVTLGPLGMVPSRGSFTVRVVGDEGQPA